jgi:dolichol-phosphate mannosyltransferase
MEDMFKPLVIVPTYNEAENISLIVPEIFKENPDVDVLVVDDNSPDGTGNKVLNMKAAFGDKLHLLSRPGKQGLGKAYIAGFKWGISNGYSHLIEMDADFSHRPLDLKKIVATLKSSQPQADVVVGSRYISGGSTVNWGLLRKVISRGGGIYATIILGYLLRDWTGGFNGWRKEVLEKINLDGVKSEGYSFQIELKFKALGHQFQVVEVPIVFEDRRIGQSKMSLKIVLEAFWRVWKMKFTAS